MFKLNLAGSFAIGAWAVIPLLYLLHTPVSAFSWIWAIGWTIAALVLPWLGK